MSDVVRVERQKIAKCFTCFICNDLFTEATTISECLHTFCKKCIYQKIEVEEIERCPKCNKNLGPSPLEKLGFDYNLQSMRNKIFGPPATTKPESSGSVLSAQLPPSPKNLSLSSLEISEPSTESLALEKNKKKSTGESSEKQVLVTSEESNEENNNGSGLKRSKRLLEAAKRNQAAKDHESNEEEEEASDAKTVYLSDLVKESNKAKSSKSKSKSKRKGKKSNGKKDSKNGSQSGPVKPQETQGQEASSDLPAPKVGNSSVEVAKKFNPVWFSLVASDKQEVGEPLPQMSAPYLRVKDGTMTVSTIKKYIVNKLNLASEDEVELTLLDQPLVNTTTLYELIEQWIEMGPKSKIIEISPGSSGKDIVMILGYARKPSPP